MSAPVAPPVSAAEQKDTCAYLNRLKDDALKARAPFEPDWWLNTAFYAGQQYTDWDDRNKTLATVPRPKGQTEHTPRPVANKIAHFVMQSHAAAMAHNPGAEVRPGTADDADRSFARVAQAYLDDITGPTQINWPMVRSEALMWALTPGTAWLKWYMDEAKGRPTVVALSPFDVAIDPYCKSWRDARYLIHTQFLDAEAVYDAYGVSVRAEGREKVDTLKSAVLSSMGYSPNLSGVTVNELWQRPSRRHPGGRYAVWTNGGRLLQVPTDLPYLHLRLPMSTGLPFSMLGAVPVPGLAYMHSFVKAMRPLQMELNSAHQQLLVSGKAFGSPKMFMDSELAKSMEHLPTDAPNELLIGDTQGGRLQPPQLLQPSAMADNGAIGILVGEMQDAVGMHEVSNGGAPGRVDSARALEMLRNEDLSRLAILNSTLDAAIGDGFWQLLQLAKQYVPDEQLATTYTRSGEPEVRKFKASRLSERHTVHVISAAAMPKTQAARNEYLLSLWNAQIVTDPRVMSELLELPYSGSASETEQDVRQATNENILLAEGVPLTPNAWDNHERHVREHNAFRKTAEFATSSDHVHSVFEAHIAWHEAGEKGEAKEFATQQAELAKIGADAAPEAAVDPAAVAGPPTAEPGQEEAAPV